MPNESVLTGCVRKNGPLISSPLVEDTGVRYVAGAFDLDESILKFEQFLLIVVDGTAEPAGHHLYVPAGFSCGDHGNQRIRRMFVRLVQLSFGPVQ